MALTWAWKLETGEAENLSPSMRWRAPRFLNRVADDEGPILAIIDYRIDPSDRSAFLAVMQDVSLERRRDGAYGWHMFEDPDEAGKMIETFLIHSALELKYRQARVTMADQMMEDKASQFLKAPASASAIWLRLQRAPRSWRKRNPALRSSA